MSHHPVTLAACRWLLVGSIALSFSPAVATDETAGISVSGTGESSGKPTLVEFRGRIAASAELTGDAKVKFADAKRRALSEIDKLKMKNLRVEMDGVVIASNFTGPEQVIELPGGQPPAAKSQVEFSAGVRLSLSIADMTEDKLMESIAVLIDRMNDAGIQLFQPNQTPNDFILDEESVPQAGQSVAMFFIEKTDELREQAYARAFASAKSNAERLAKLAGVKLGPVAALSELAGGAEPIPWRGAFSQAASGSEADKERGRVGSHKFGPIPVRVTLSVRFEIQK